MHTPRWLSFLAPILVCLTLYGASSRADHAAVSIGTGTASAINTESAVTLGQSQWSFGVRQEYIEFDRYSDAQLTKLRLADPEADIHSVDSLLSGSAGIFFGVTDDFTVGLRVPFIQREGVREPEHGHGAEEEEHEDEEEEEGHHAEGEEEGHHEAGGMEDIIEELGDSEGLGDMTVFGQYRFFQRNNTHASALFGVKMPTGNTNEKSSEGEFETEFQPGSGSWDGLFGLAFTQILGPLTFDANVLYSLVTEGSRDTDLGDIFDYNAAVSYRVGGASTARQRVAGGGPALDLVLEANGEWRDREEVKGVEDPNSGGNVVYISPGVRFVGGRNWNIAGSFGFPVINNPNHDQVEANFRVITNLNISLP